MFQYLEAPHCSDYLYAWWSGWRDNSFQASCMAHFNMCWPAIDTEQNHCYTGNLNFNISNCNAVVQNQGYSLFSPHFSLFIALLSDRSDAQEWPLTQHICSPCVAESHILFSLPKVTNIYFLLDSPTELLQKKEKQVRFHSALLIKRSLLVHGPPLLRVVETLEYVQTRAMEMIRKEDVW